MGTRQTGAELTSFLLELVTTNNYDSNNRSIIFSMVPTILIHVYCNGFVVLLLTDYFYVHVHEISGRIAYNVI